jgi:hypothetical protein
MPVVCPWETSGLVPTSSVNVARSKSMTGEKRAGLPVTSSATSGLAGASTVADEYTLREPRVRMYLAASRRPAAS